MLLKTTRYGHSRHRSDEGLLPRSASEYGLEERGEGKVDGVDCCCQVLDSCFVGKSNSADFSEKWKRDFSHRPTWCDADMALQQIHRGKAKGRNVTLYSRSAMQRMLFHLGCFVETHALAVILVGCLVYFFCCFGLQYVRIETDIVKLWVSEGGRLDGELHFLSRVQTESHKLVHKRDAEHLDPVKVVNAIKSRHGKGPELPKENGLGGGFQVVIQTSEMQGQNLLTRDGLLRHVQIMREIADYKVFLHGENWTLSDICFKPPGPAFNEGPLSGLLSVLLDRIIPCIWITPIDCFWEGSKPLGPFPPLNFGPDIASFVGSLPKGNITWKNLDPTKVLSEVGLLFDLGTIGNFFQRAGIGSAYLDRWCIEPLDPECPLTAPNGYDVCHALKQFRKWNSGLVDEEKVILQKEDIKQEEGDGGIAEKLITDLIGKKRRKRAASAATKNATMGGDYYAYDDDSDYDSSSSDNGTTNSRKDKEALDMDCVYYGKSFRSWMMANSASWGKFLTEKEKPVYPDYGEIFTGGCKGFAKEIMSWPEDLIIGGVKRQHGKVVAAEALQSVFLVSSGYDVFLRYKEAKPDLKPNLDVAAWTPHMANEVVVAWQRNYTRRLYDHRWNVDTTNRQVHPLASTSIADMLEQFSQFNFLIIIVGYVLMLIYAMWSQLRWSGWWLAYDSAAGLAFIGVMLVTYSSLAGLGLATWVGIEFNAATTQIVPFLTLGLGVDDMFLLLHNYNEVVHTVREREVGILMKETGMSIVITSTNNILAFMAGTVLPIPALRSFCSQSSILLFFNLVAIMSIYPAFIAFDLRRRKAGHRDILCCVGDSAIDGEKEKQPDASSKATPPDYFVVQKPSPPPEEEEEEEKILHWYTLSGFLKLIYIPLLLNPMIKMLILVVCTAMFLFGVVGLSQATLGLELSDVLPQHTAPAAFLRAREKYFSFYPMYAVLKGPDIDYPNMQHKIEQYRSTISQSHFVIKVRGQPSEEYWLSLMRTWLRSIQKDFDEALEQGKIDRSNGSIVHNAKLSDEARIARRLICSNGNRYNCIGRIDKVKLVEEDGTVRSDIFYNCLTAWYNVDNMMYYVSQASFFPTPPGWGLDKSESVVPPARPLAYSQIPFYQTGLINTPVIVEMIKEVRTICDQFTADGLPNFPTGIAFTFWEQYLFLNQNLLTAVCVIAACVFLVISLLVFNPWAAVMVMVVVVSMTIELAGFMGLAGVKLNPVSAVTLVTAVGIGVEFTAHVVLAFLTSMGTRNDRMVACMDHMFVPVIHGGLSTLLGIIMLAFSEFDFVIKYFFVVMTALVLIGLVNGLALLPVLLSIAGPPCEIETTDGSNFLPVPPPLPTKPRGENASDVEMQISVKMKAPETGRFHDSLSTITEEEGTAIVRKSGTSAGVSIPNDSEVQLNIRMPSGRRRDNERNGDDNWSGARTPSPIDHSSSSNHLI